jgi:hypothetical protein
MAPYTTQPVISESPDCDQIVLLSADDWHFNLSTDAILATGSSIYLPQLPVLLDCFRFRPNCLINDD